MKRNYAVRGVLCFVVFAVGVALCSPAMAGNASGIKKVAIVSFTVSDVAGSVRAGSVGSTPVAKLMDDKVNDMLVDAEKKLGRKWTVAAAAGFIDNAAYRNAGVERTLTVFVPRLKGRDMPVFTQVSKEIKSGKLDPEKAKQLCKALQVDAVVLIFSEWSAKTGGFVPTTKALTKNVLTIWNSNGDMVIKERVDMVGKKTLGVSGMKAVNEQTIGEWSDSFSRAMDKIIESI